MSPRHRCQTVGFGYLRSLVKKIQFRERQLLIPVLRLSQGHPLCPVHSYERHILEFPVTQPSPAFLHYRKGHATPNTHSAFTDKLRKVLSHAGFPANKFSGHSFRRGGASYAFRCGAPVELISLQGRLVFGRCFALYRTTTWAATLSGETDCPKHWLFITFIFNYYKLFLSLFPSPRFSFFFLSDFLCLAVWESRIKG